MTHRKLFLENHKLKTTLLQQNWVTLMKYAITITACIIGFLSTFFFDVVQVTGHSMNPTLQEGNFLILNHSKNYQHNDLIVFRSPESLKARPPRFIKRIIATSDDSISIQKGQVYLNGQILQEPYTPGNTNDSFPELLISKGEVIAFEGFAIAELPDYLKETLTMLRAIPQDILEQSQHNTVSYTGTIKLKEGFYFVLGDNREYGGSEDSRVFGAISKDALLGKVAY